MGILTRTKAAGKETLGILKRIKNRDFAGDTGAAIKNSTYNLGTNIVAKAGSIIFTIIIARLLMPELFGLYSLALSTIVIFSAFSDLGISTAVIKFMAFELSKRNGKPEKYYTTLLRWKVYLVLLVCLAMLLSAGFLSTRYYDKPIFLALIAGSFYILVSSLMSFFVSVFQAYNDFKKNLLKETIFQVARLILVPLSIIYFLSKGTELFLLCIFLSLSLSYLLGLIYLLIKNKKYVPMELSSPEKKKLFFFVLPLSATALSGMFFGYVDMIMLGRFVESAFIGYYQAAIALIGSAGAVIGFSGALFPLFSKLKGKRLRLLFFKSVKYTFLFSFLGIIATLLLANWGVLLLYGAAYFPAALLLKILAVIILIDPLIGIYSGFLISQGRTKIIALLLIISTLINIFLNYSLISYGLTFSHYAAAIGAAIATIIAKALHLGFLIFYKNKA